MEVLMEDYITSQEINKIQHPADRCAKKIICKDLDYILQIEIMTPEEVAQYLRKSTSWVYKNWKILGGKKLGGSLFFPRKEDLYEHIFSQGKGMEVRLHPEGNPAHRSLVQNKSSGKTGRSKKKGGDIKPKASAEDQNRHGLLGTG